MNAFRALALCAFFMLALTSGCGKSKNLGENVELSVKPNTALIGPGPLDSCKAVRDLPGPVLSYNRLKLKWTSVDTLYVSGIRIRVEGGGITNGSFQKMLDAEETAILLGNTGGVIAGNSDIQSGCALRLGAIPLAEGEKTRPFRARVTIELIGYAEDPEGNQRFVKQSIVTNAEYFGS